MTGRMTKSIWSIHTQDNNKIISIQKTKERKRKSKDLGKRRANIVILKFSCASTLSNS